MDCLTVQQLDFILPLLERSYLSLSELCKLGCCGTGGDHGRNTATTKWPLCAQVSIVLCVCVCVCNLGAIEKKLRETPIRSTKVAYGKEWMKVN